MPPGDIECFEALTGPLLEELGYPRTVARLRPEMVANACLMTDRFREDMLSLGDWLP